MASRSKLSKKEAAFIDVQRVARLATAGGDGVIHNVPMCPVLDDGKIYLATDEGRKVSNIRENPRATIVFDEYTEDWAALRQVMVTGDAALIVKGPRFRALAKRLYEKYLQYPTAGGGIEEGDAIIIEITPRRVVSSGL